jgi:transcriptional regulator with XRE-family HTH domain
MLRHRTRCSRNDLAALAGLSAGALSNYENDGSLPSAAALRRLTRALAERLGCDVSELWQSLGQLLDAVPAATVELGDDPAGSEFGAN